MKSLFNKENSEEFISRIYKLSAGSQANWGKMNVSQMLHHCQKPLEIATGDLTPKTNRIIKFLFGKSAKKQLIRDPEFKRNLPTFPEAKIADRRVFETEKTRLISLIENFQAKGPAGLTKKPHPFFGELSVEEWDTLQVKHLDHHLRQFGI